MTHVRMKRTVNQDHCDIVSLCDGAAVLAIVCDGMGGSNGGDTASKIAAENIKNYVLNSFVKTMNSQQIENILRTAIYSANLCVYEASRNDEELSGMGTTAGVVFVHGNIAYVLHVGDSRVYLFRNDELNQVTVDHSLVQTMVDNGEITPEEALVHPNKNIITRAIGTRDDVIVDLDILDLKDNDVILLCSDGLSNFVSDENIAVALSNFGSGTAQSLIDLANQGGGGDNITAVVLKY